MNPDDPNNSPTSSGQGGIPGGGAGPTPPPAPETCSTCGGGSVAGTCTNCNQPNVACTCPPAAPSGGEGEGMGGGTPPMGGPSVPPAA